MPTRIVTVTLKLQNADLVTTTTVSVLPFVGPTLRSPNFQDANYTSGNGIQFTDAVQRAEFFHYMKPSWHTELSPAGVVDHLTLSVPRFQQQVTVIGEVQNVTSHLYHPKLGRDDYIALSGGVTRRADRGKIYIVRASGSVIATEGSRWFQHGGNVAIKPGDTIVVPLDTEHIPALPLWTQVTQILYNIAIAVLAVNSI